MKRHLSALVFIFIFSLLFSTVSSGQGITVDIAGKKINYTSNVYNLELNGIWIPTQTPCVVISGFAYVPLREVFGNYLGMTVGYDENNGTAYVQSGSKRMDFNFSNQAIYKNGVKVDTDLPVASINGNTMVPLTLTASYFGLTAMAKDENKVLTIQWNGKDENTAIVKESNVSGTVEKISYCTENGNEIILIETGANIISNHYVLVPMDGNAHYRLCVQFGNADINVPGKLDVYSGSIQQIRYAQVDGKANISNVVIEINHNPKYTVDVVYDGIKITIISDKTIKEPTNNPTPTKAPEPTPVPTQAPAPKPTEAPKPTLTPAPKPTEAAKPTPAPIVTPSPSKQVGSGALYYTMEGEQCIVWLNGINLQKEIQENSNQYRVEYRDVEKILHISMPLNKSFKNEVLPGNNLLHGIISTTNNLHNEINIRISGKDDFKWAIASSGGDQTKIVLSNPEDFAVIPTITPTPTPVSPTPNVPANPTPTPTPAVTPSQPTVTPIPTPSPSTGGLANRGDGDRSGTISYVAGSDRIIIEALELQEYKVYRLSNPARIVIDLSQNVIDSKEVTVASSRLYSKIRTGQFDKTTARIVLEVPDNINYEAIEKNNRLTVILSYSGVKNLTFIGDIREGAIRLTGDGLRDKIKDNITNIIAEEDKSLNAFTFVFPNGIIDLGNGKLEVGDSIMKSIQTVTSGNTAFLLIDRENHETKYKFRFNDSNDEVFIEWEKGENSGGTSSKEPSPNTDTGSSTEQKDNVQPTPSGKLVVIDAGHGGSDPGAVYGKDEKWYNLDITLRLEKLLKEKGVNVKLTRTTDTFVGLDERAKMANDWNADVFISIHNNALYKAMHGTMTFFYTGSYTGKEYATIIHNDLLKNLGTNDLGVKSANFVVIKKTKMPAVLVEIGCLTNDDELAKLNTEAYRQKAAESLCESILKIVSK